MLIDSHRWKTLSANGFLGYCKIELRRDVTFDEDTTFIKSKKDKEDEEEHETPKAAEFPKPVRNGE